MSGYFTEEQPQGLEITELGKSYMLEAARWAKFLAIMGFIIMGLGIIASVSMVFSPVENIGPYAAYMAMAKVFGWFTLIFLVIFTYPWYTLYKFATRTKMAVAQHNNVELENAFRNLKRTFKFWGIYTILILLCYGIFIIFIATIAATAAI